MGPGQVCPAVGPWRPPCIWFFRIFLCLLLGFLVNEQRGPAEMGSPWELLVSRTQQATSQNEAQFTVTVRRGALTS